MSPEAWIAIIAQTIIIVVAIVSAFVKTEKRITRVETKVEHLEVTTMTIPGISRHLAELKGQMQAHRSESGH
jgi:hypothetical protein